MAITQRSRYPVRVRVRVTASLRVSGVGVVRVRGAAGVRVRGGVAGPAARWGGSARSLLPPRLQCLVDAVPGGDGLVVAGVRDEFGGAPVEVVVAVADADFGGDVAAVLGGLGVGVQRGRG